MSPPAAGRPPAPPGPRGHSVLPTPVKAVTMTVTTPPAPTGAASAGTAPRSGRPRRRRPWPVGVLALVTAAVVVYLLTPYLPPSVATSRIPIRDGVHLPLLVAHIFTAAVAALTGPLQFWPWLRGRYPAVHRWTGRAYFFAGVFPSALLAVPVTVLAPMGSANQAGLIFLDVLWAATAVAGWRTVRQGRYADHRRWMIRNFALTFGSLASRFWTFLMVAVTLPQAGTSVYRGDQLAVLHDIASGSVWLGTAVNLVIAEWYLQRRYGVPARGARSAPRTSAARAR